MLKSIQIKCKLTYKVKIFCQFGVRVLYSVCVCNLEFMSSKTQNGSLLPPRSAAARPCARYTCKKIELETNSHNIRFVKKFVCFILIKVLWEKKQFLFNFIEIERDCNSKVFIKKWFKNSKLNTILKYNFY